MGSFGKTGFWAEGVGNRDDASACADDSGGRGAIGVGGGGKKDCRRGFGARRWRNMLSVLELHFPWVGGTLQKRCPFGVPNGSFLGPKSGLSGAKQGDVLKHL